ncbi:M56 family metallopeptidase [Streptomyces sp. NPDC052236]|uniref:M56 family metallopeptidase n=1 Tax=Streptomyces sp. NPDC052236 TaxID=3365686 RepID=UPI0037D153CB
MNAAPALLGYTAIIGFAAPRLILRSAWPHRAPALAVAAWHAVAASFCLSAALAAYQLATPTGHFHAGLVGFLHACGVEGGAAATDPTAADQLAVALPSALALALVVSFVVHVTRAGRARARHRDALDKVGIHSPRLRATVLSHDTPAAYCLPGRHSRIVVSDAAVRLLSHEQLDAVLEHERAHVAGRHHLVLAVMEAFATVFRWLPLARHAKEQTAILLEMVADDRALRSHERDVLASAMYEMAAGRAPKSAFGAGGHTVLIRMQRILDGHRGTHPGLWGSVAAAAAAVPLLPLLVACAPGH